MIGTLRMRKYEVSKVKIDGKNMTVVTHFGDDPELHENWLHVVVGYNMISRLVARRWIGAHVYTIDYYREAAHHFNDIQAFIATTPNKSVNSTRERHYRRAYSTL